MSKLLYENVRVEMLANVLEFLGVTSNVRVQKISKGLIAR